MRYVNAGLRFCKFIYTKAFGGKSEQKSNLKNREDAKRNFDKNFSISLNKYTSKSLTEHKQSSLHPPTKFPQSEANPSGFGFGLSVGLFGDD